jgi:hypothetical protein
VYGVSSSADVVALRVVFVTTLIRFNNKGDDRSTRDFHDDDDDVFDDVCDDGENASTTTTTDDKRNKC